MKKTIVLPIALVFALAMMLFSSCTISIRKINGNESGETTRKTYDVGAFSGIASSVPNANIFYEEADTFSVEVSGNNIVHEFINMSVSDSILYINFNQDEDYGVTKSEDGRTIKIKGVITSNHDDNINIYIKAPQLSRITCNGGTQFKADKITADNTLYVQSNGTVEFNVGTIEAMSTEIHSNGACEAKIKSLNSKSIIIDSNGAGDIEADIYNADITDLITAGGSEYKINFHGECDKLRIIANGATELTLNGQINSMEKNIHGAADINMNNLKVNNK